MTKIICTKLSFPTEKNARENLEAIRKQHRGNKLRNVYFCKCGKWHMTSKRNLFEIKEESAMFLKKLQQYKSENKRLKMENYSLKKQLKFIQRKIPE